MLNALAAWGINAISRFNGMFAIALWDRKEHRLLLARDRYGMKPLYYSRYGRSFAFASEQKAILADAAKSREIDLPAMLEYFTFQNFFTERTLTGGRPNTAAGHYPTLELRAPNLPSSSIDIGISVFGAGRARQSPRLR